MAVKKAQAQNKAVAAPETANKTSTVSGLVAVTVGAGPIHHAGRHYSPGESLDVTPEVAAALIGAKLVKAK